MGEDHRKLDAFAGAFRQESVAGERITSATESLGNEVAAPEVPGGAMLIREGLDAEREPSVATLTEQMSTPGSGEAGLEESHDVRAAALGMQLLVDLPADWPGWSLARRALKRSLDVALSLLAICLLLPVFAAIALAVRIESPGPVFYCQRRCGRDGRTFEMLKFRSMIRDADRLLTDLRDHNEADGLLFKLKHDPRVTRVGAFIRRYSIDELPQLVNVLKGEMSLVGPRPLPLDPEDFGPIDGKRHAVRPGLTCYWQVSGRSDVSYGQMVEMDLVYIRDSSTWTDLRLIAMTFPAVLGGSGAY